MKYKVSNKTILLFIIIVASILRFYNFFSIPFMHDEFSALFRLNFNSFTDLIEYGVKVDGHPAGVHVFLYYWGKLFGHSEYALKFPFAIAGILSVGLIYLIGKKWYNETVGLIATAFIASLHFPIVYSQIARPYISGMFLVLAMVYYWTKIIKHPENNLIRNSILFIVFASACTYNHHFSLLFAAIVGISGVFFVKKRHILSYFICGLSIFIIYIPHLPIFIHQLGYGGVGGSDGWLAAPHKEFIIDFIYYVFNYSIFSLILALTIVIYGIKNSTPIRKNQTILFISWFFIPFLIGYFYSVRINPVLQFSVLIFSFPFLFYILFGHFKELNVKTNFLIIAVILTVNILTLTIERKHYTHFYHPAFEEIIKDLKAEQLKSPQSIYLIDSHKKISNYYIKKHKVDSSFRWVDSFQTLGEFNAYLLKNEKSHSSLFLGTGSSINPVIVAMIKEVYPVIKKQTNYSGGASYWFSKGIAKKNNLTNISSVDFETLDFSNWTNITDLNIKILNNENKAYVFDSTTEWGPNYSIDLLPIIKSQNDYIDISVKVINDNSLDDALLVSSITTMDSTIYWTAMEFSQFKSIEDSSEWLTIHQTLKLSDIYFNYKQPKFNFFIWNKKHSNFIIDDLRIDLRKGNPYLYWFSEK